MSIRNWVIALTATAAFVRYRKPRAASFTGLDYDKNRTTTYDKVRGKD